MLCQCYTYNSERSDRIAAAIGEQWNSVNLKICNFLISTAELCNEAVLCNEMSSSSSSSSSSVMLWSWKYSPSLRVSRLFSVLKGESSVRAEASIVCQDWASSNTCGLYFRPESSTWWCNVFNALTSGEEWFYNMKRGFDFFNKINNLR